MSRYLNSAILICALSACGPAGGHGGVTWHDHIAPIVAQRCAECHAPGRAGGVVFDERSAPALAQLMLQKIEAGDMPPWLPGGDSLSFERDRRLSDGELALFRTWARSPVLGAPRAALPPDQGQAPDPTVTLLTAPYRSARVGVSDEIRCFLLTPPPGFVTGYAWRVDELGAVHHFAADVVSAADVAKLRAMYGTSDQGWDCPGTLPVAALSTMINTSAAPESRYQYAAGYGLEIPTGAGLVLSVHVLPNRQRHADANGVALWYAAAPVKPVSVWTILAPSDLPCPPSMAAQPQCQRAYAESQAILSDLIPQRADIVQRCGGAEVPGAETADSFPVRTSCAGPLNPGVLRVLSVRIHAHTLMTRAQLRAQRPDGSWMTLLEIPRWRWRWEDMFVPVDDIRISGRAEIECEYDNGRGNQWSALTGEPADGPGIPPLQQPRAHVLSLNRADEMCLATIEWAAP